MAQKFKTDKPSLQEIRKIKKPKRQSVSVVLDPEMSTKISEKEMELERARIRQKPAGRSSTKSLADGSDVVALEKELDKLFEDAGDFLAEFTFQDPGMKKYDDLVSACPPTPKQKELWKEGGGEGSLAYNPDEFVPKLLALCAYEPKMLEEEAFEICDEWGTGDITRMFQTAQSVCLVSAPIPLSQRSLTDTVETPNSDSN